MLSTFIIVFREALEAMLVVGIAMAAARQAHIEARWVYIGIASGLVVAMVVAFFANMLASSFSGMGQEVFNATILLSAAFLMVWTAIWMRKHGKEMSQNIRQVCQTTEGNRATKWILATVVCLAVAREGSEVVLFLHGVSAAGNSGVNAMWMGGALGLVVGTLVATALYLSLIRIPMRYVFSVVTGLIVLLAAGMASQGVAYLVMIDVLPALGQTLWNTSGIISERSVLGQLLHALMGYDDRPSGMQVFIFTATIVLTWLAIHWQTKTLARTVSAVATVMMMSVAILPSDAEAKKVYSPIVEEGEIEVEYLLDYSFDADTAKNTSARHQFEFEVGVTDRWMTAIYGDFRRRPNQKFAYQGLKWENIYQLFEQGEYWLDTGLYFEYIKPTRSLNKADVFELKLLFEQEQGRYINTMNLLFKKEIGSKAKNNTIAGYAWRSKWRWKRELEPAIEFYGWVGEIGNMNPLAQQQHQVGPVLLGKMRNGINYEIGYLFGLTSATDQGMLKFVMGYEF